MIWKPIVIAAIMALAATSGAEAGFWGDLKQSFGTAVDNAKRDGARAADAVAEGAEDAVDYVAGDSENTDPQAVDDTADPVADEPKQLTKQPKK